MGWQDKALQKRRMEKQVEEIMKSPEYKELEQKRNDEILNQSIATLSFIACEFLKNNHGYKKAGLTKFLKYVNACMACSAKQDDFFTAQDEYYKEMMQLDVLAEFGLKVE